MTQLAGGSNYDIHFQQNLNHFFKEDPGHLVADFATTSDPVESDFTPLGEPIADYNALNMITQTNFTMSVVVPNVDCEHCVVRLRYVSNNPTEDHGGGMIFYQCADVAVEKSESNTNTIESSPTTRIEVKPTPTVELKDHSCCAAEQFTVEGYETSSWRAPTNKHYYIDGVNQVLRVDTDSGSGITAKDGSFQMYNNFTSGVEYYYNVHANSCDLYGLNLWSDWCYGASNAQSPMDVINIAGQVADVWSMQEDGVESPFIWTNARKGCVPVGMNRADTSETTIFFNYHATAPSMDSFKVPQACIDAENDRMQSGLALAPSPQEHAITRHEAVRL